MATPRKARPLRAVLIAWLVLLVLGSQSPHQKAVSPYEAADLKPTAASLTVNLEGPTNALASIQSFTVYGRPQGTDRWTEKVEVLDSRAEEATATLQSLSPGEWDLLVLVVDRSGQIFPFGGMHHRLQVGEAATVPVPVALFRGLIVRLGRPVESVVELYPKVHEPGSIRVHVRTGKDGVFQILARPGIYDVVISSRAGAVRTTILDVEFPASGEPVTLDLGVTRQ